MSKLNHVGVRFDDRQKEALDRAAAVEDRTPSALVRLAVGRWLKDHGYLKDDAAARKAG